MVLLAYLFADHPFIESLLQNTTKALPYYLSGALLFISLTFNRSRLALAAINVCLAYAFIQNGLQSTLQQPATMMLYHITTFMFCLNLCLIACYRERGSLTAWGIARVLLVFASYLPFWWLYKNGLADMLHKGVTQALPPWWFEQPAVDQWLPVAQSWLTDRPWLDWAWLLTFGLSGAYLLLAAIIRRTSIEFALVLAWLSGMLVFYDFAHPDISVYMFSVLTIALFVAFIQITYDLAYVDTLTELPGRRALLEKLGTLTGNYAIAMLDVDHFKKFNDTYGHDVGDQVLKLVASHIRKVKGRGTAYRYGGEEFTVVFSRKCAASAEPFLEALRQAIEDYTMVIRDKGRSTSKKSGSKQRGQTAPAKTSVHITVSIGVAERNTSHCTPDQVMDRADKALYQSKQTGRNRVTRFQEAY